MGDTFFNGMYPFIDPKSGGHIRGMIACADRALKIVNDETKIIPGHGELAGVAQLREYRSMLATVHDRIAKLRAAGKSVDEIVAARPAQEFDATWGQGFMKPEPWIRIVCEGIEKNG